MVPADSAPSSGRVFALARVRSTSPGRHDPPGPTRMACASPTPYPRRLATPFSATRCADACATPLPQTLRRCRQVTSWFALLRLPERVPGRKSRWRSPRSRAGSLGRQFPLVARHEHGPAAAAVVAGPRPAAGRPRLPPTLRRKAIAVPVPAHVLGLRCRCPGTSRRPPRLVDDPPSDRPLPAGWRFGVRSRTGSTHFLSRSPP